MAMFFAHAPSPSGSRAAPHAPCRRPTPTRPFAVTHHGQRGEAELAATFDVLATRLTSTSFSIMPSSLLLLSCC